MATLRDKIKTKNIVINDIVTTDNNIIIPKVTKPFYDYSANYAEIEFETEDNVSLKEKKEPKKDIFGEKIWAEINKLVVKQRVKIPVIKDANPLNLRNKITKIAKKLIEINKANNNDVDYKVNSLKDDNGVITHIGVLRIV